MDCQRRQSGKSYQGPPRSFPGLPGIAGRPPMLHTPDFLAQLPSCDVCVVGAGPIGIAAALALEDAGLSVLLIESGEIQQNTFAASLGAGHGYDPQHHADPSVAMCRGLGGTSRWWGGRCVAFDDIDLSLI